MNDPLRTLAAVAAVQHGAVARVQASTAGLSRWAIGRHVHAGTLLPIGPRTFHFAGTALSWRGRLMAGLLDLGESSFVAGRSAAALHGLDGFDEGPLEFVVPRDQRNRSTDGRVTGTGPVATLDRGSVDGLRCVTATLAIIQIARDRDRSATANALDSAVRLRLTSPGFVARRLADHRGSPGVPLVQELLVDAGVESWLERRFLALLRSAGLPHPALQRVYRRDGRHVARVDFDFAPWPVIVEVGGQKGYLTTRERQRQERRRNDLHLLGKAVYFFSYEDVTGEPGYVARTVRSALDATSRAAS
jgi:hypothetical protein